MDILFNVNIGYLLLMGGIFLGAMALLSPGTGLLELGALLAFVLVGIQIFSLPINLWSLGIVLVGAILFGMAIWRRGQNGLLAAGLVILFLGAAFLYRGENSVWGVNPWLVLVVSTLEGTFIWLLTKKIIGAMQTPPRQNIEHLIGQIGETRTEVHREGSVYVSGELWSAQSEVSIPVNTRVRVVSREGFILVVEAEA